MQTLFCKTVSAKVDRVRLAVEPARDVKINPFSTDIQSDVDGLRSFMGDGVLVYPRELMPRDLYSMMQVVDAIEAPCQSGSAEIEEYGARGRHLELVEDFEKYCFYVGFSSFLGFNALGKTHPVPSITISTREKALMEYEFLNDDSRFQQIFRENFQHVDSKTVILNLNYPSKAAMSSLGVFMALIEGVAQLKLFNSIDPDKLEFKLSTAAVEFYRAAYACEAFRAFVIGYELLDSPLMPCFLAQFYYKMQHAFLRLDYRERGVFRALGWQFMAHRIERYLPSTVSQHVSSLTEEGYIEDSPEGKIFTSKFFTEIPLPRLLGPEFSVFHTAAVKCAKDNLLSRTIVEIRPEYQHMI